MTMTWYKSKTFLLFIVLLLHITLLDLVMVTYSGATLLIDKNIELKTILTHLFITSISVGFYFLLNQSVKLYKSSKIETSDLMWWICSIILVAVIGFILI